MTLILLQSLQNNLHNPSLYLNLITGMTPVTLLTLITITIGRLVRDNAATYNGPTHVSCEAI